MRGRVYQREKGGNWYVDYTYQGRRFREMIGTSKKMAESVLAKRISEAVEGRHLDMAKDVRIQFDDFCELYRKNHIESNQRTGNSHRNGLKKLKFFFGKKIFSDIKTMDIERYKQARLLEKVAPSTINRDLALLRSMCNRSVEWGYCQKSLMKGVRLYRENNQRLRYLEKEEIDRLLRNSSYILRFIILIAVHTGMRKGEILGLKWDDVNESQNFITLRHTKNGETRYIPMNEVIQDALRERPRHPNSAYVICNKEGKSFNFRKTFETAVKNAGLSDFRFHDLRHTFASQMRMSGVDLHTIGELMGHKSLQMTKRYAHLSPEAKTRAVEVLSQKIGTRWAQKPISVKYEVDHVSASHLLRCG